jgi:hypothetical protein
MNKNICITFVIVSSFLLVSCGPSEAEIKALEEAKKIEIAKCVRYNADIVYQDSFETHKSLLESMDKAFDSMNRAMGNSWKTSNEVRKAGPEASKVRDKFMPYLKEMCEDSLLFIYSSEQEIPERFHEELGIKK